MRLRSSNHGLVTSFALVTSLLVTPCVTLVIRSLRPLSIGGRGHDLRAVSLQKLEIGNVKKEQQYTSFDRRKQQQQQQQQRGGIRRRLQCLTKIPRYSTSSSEVDQARELLLGFLCDLIFLTGAGTSTTNDLDDLHRHRPLSNT